ncbi:S1C family serine protease [Kitasatospora purpeofusca]|uniref:S1C family serine protease n=1 Tax=Kitasatospora purpeofusca TaxID=67352 RepID=UPI002A5A9FD5|nr:S1C family serine protease [Kitasatospora purpeofusca]MDY0814265.1 S1C family serine protease [Kitasatospora purpeofusca]
MPGLLGFGGLPGEDDGIAAGDPGRRLLRIHDRDGRPRGLGFVLDPLGTVLTAHETVAGLDGIVLHLFGGRTRVLGPDHVRLLPGHGLALLRTDAVGGLPVPPLPVAPPPAAGDGGVLLVPVPVRGEGRADGRTVLLRCGLAATTGAVYPQAGRFHLIDGVLLLDVPSAADAAVVPAGAPVLDAASGTVVAVVAPGLRIPGRPGRPTAVPVTAVGADVPELAEALARNAAGVPAYGSALNLAGVLRLAAAQLAAAGAGPDRVAALAADRVDRPDGLAEWADLLVDGDPFDNGWSGGSRSGDGRPEQGRAAEVGVVALVGAAGTGRSTEAAAVAVRRGGGESPRPTVWLRGADLGPGDASLADAVERALRSASAELGVPAPAGPGAAAALCAAAGRPLLVVLDGPEESPVPLDADWLRASAYWLAAAGARLLTACGEEVWERLAPGGAEGEFLVPVGAPVGAPFGAPVRSTAVGAVVGAAAGTPAGGPAHGAGAVRVVVRRLGPLPVETAERVRRRYGVPPGWPAAQDARHPLALRLAGELWAEGLRGEPVGRTGLFAAHLDLRCLRVAQRLAEDGRPRRPGAHRRGAVRPARASAGRVRRTAAAVAGWVHEAARRMLGAEQGALARAAFEELFPVAGGWATAVLAEGLFVPAGSGYRFAHGEFADWLQGLHLDLDSALRLLLGEAEDTPPAPGAGPAGAIRTVPRHRIGPVVAALRRVGTAWGAPALDPWLHRIWRAVDLRPAGSEPAWWAGRLLVAGLAAGPELAEHRALLEQLAERIVERAAVAGGFERLPAEGLGRFGPSFWGGLGLPPEAELALFRRLVAADGPERPFLAAVAARLRADPPGVLPPLCGWFDDPRGLPARPGSTVADLAHDLLFAHRSLFLDELTEVLVGAAHPGADALLAVLAVEEPSALCRAVDRWSHDPRPERHVAAAVHALHAAPYARGAGPELLRFTALALLAREDEPALHGAALALLLREPGSRAVHLPAALAVYRGGEDRFLTARALAPALESDPEPVLAALADRLGGAGAAARPGAPVAGTLRVLADARAPLAARRGAEFAARLLRERPELAGPVAVDYLGRRLARGGVEGAVARLELRVLLSGALAARAAAVRRPFAEVLSRPVPDPVADALRCELLDTLLATERDPEVLAAALAGLAEHCAAERPARVRAVVVRVAAALPGADGLLVRCADRSAAFAALLARWPEDGLPARPVGPRLDRLRALVAAGRDPRDAAAEAERAGGAGAARPPGGGARNPAVRPTCLPVPNSGHAHGTL